MARITCTRCGRRYRSDLADQHRATAVCQVGHSHSVIVEHNLIVFSAVNLSIPVFFWPSNWIWKNCLYHFCADICLYLREGAWTSVEIHCPNALKIPFVETGDWRERVFCHFNYVNFVILILFYLPTVFQLCRRDNHNIDGLRQQKRNNLVSLWVILIVWVWLNVYMTILRKRIINSSCNIRLNCFGENYNLYSATVDCTLQENCSHNLILFPYFPHIILFPYLSDGT